MPDDATWEGGPSAPSPGPPAANTKRGGFKIPKLAPAVVPNDGPSSAAADTSDAVPLGDTSLPTNANRKDRKDRTHKGTRKHKHLLVLDLNGLLVDRRMSPCVEQDGTKRVPDAKFGKFFIYNRPQMNEFVNWLHDKFTVGVWSSAQQHNAKQLVSHIWGKQRDKLAFVWGQDRCTHVGAMDPKKPQSKPILLKDLNELWKTPSYARFGPRNTLLIDDSPYKAVMNPANCAIHPEEYKLGGEGGGRANSVETAEKKPDDRYRASDDGKTTDSSVLGEHGALRLYLSKLADCDFVDEFVATNSFASFGPVAPDSPEEIITKAREGGAKVLAAAAAAASGVDANEIILDDEFEDENDDVTELPKPTVEHPADRCGSDGEDVDVVETKTSGEKRGRDEPAATTSADENKQKRKKRPKKVFTGSGACLFLKRWGWKREAKSDEERFHKPYVHEMKVRSGSTVPMGFDAEDGDASTRTVALSFRQARFDDEDNNGAVGGFASTVWDSAIVLAKFIEKHQQRFRGLRVVELGAGCGLVSASLLHAGAARVVATDLAPNLLLLRENLLNSAPSTDASKGEGRTWDVRALPWGADASTHLDNETFDLVVATDCMYVVESATALCETLVSLIGKWHSTNIKLSRTNGFPVLMSYGRNRQAEAAFEEVSTKGFTFTETGVTISLTGTDVPEQDLDELYQCSDVRVVKYKVSGE